MDDGGSSGAADLYAQLRQIDASCTTNPGQCSILTERNTSNQIDMRNILWCTCVLFFLTIPSLSGQSTDSLKQVFASTTHPEVRIGIAIELGKKYLYANPDSAKYYLDISVRELPPTGMDSLYILTYDRYCGLYELMGKNKEAMDMIYKAWQRVNATGREASLDEMYTLIGRIHMRMANYDSATYYWTRLLENKQKHGDEYGQWVAYHYLASMYDDLGDWPKSKIYYEKALEKVRLEKKPKDYPYLLFLYMNACQTHQEYDLYSELRNEYLAFKLSQGQILLSSEHSIMMKVDQTPAERRAELLKYLPYHTHNKSYYVACESWYRIGQTYMQESNYDAAIEALHHMLSYTDSVQVLGLKHNGHVEMYKAYLAKKDYQKALEHYQIVYDLRDSVLNAEKQVQMNELSVKYETAEKEKQLAETTLNLDRSRKNQELFGLGFMMALLAAGFAFYAFRTKAKNNKVLEDKNKVIATALDEKDILLREIHHRVKNNLQMISALLYLHGKSVDDSNAQEALMESQNRVQSMAMIHQNLYQDKNLLGVSVSDYLDKLLQHLISAYNIEHNRIKIERDIQVPNLDVDTVIPLALIINELISNALKYAFRDGRQGIIFIAMHQDESGLQVDVKDNGMGLPAHFTVESSSNFGLKLIQILCDRLGASWKVETDQGTRISLQVPMKKAA